MESLHEEGPNTSHHGGKISVSHPRCFIWHVESRSVTGCDFLEPRWNAIGISGEEDAEAFGEVLLEGVVLQEIDRAELPRRYARKVDEQATL